MRKRFLPDALGRDSHFWEKIWSRSILQDSLRFCEIDPLRKIFNRFFPGPPAKILEAGCGLGHNVINYRRKGYDVEGIDYAKEAIDTLRSFDPSLPVKVGNILSLPYPDNHFSVYYSGGVVEHFEEGPDNALKEARRVLCKEGILIITVPFINFMRYIRDSSGVLFFKKNRIINTIDIDGFPTSYYITHDFKSSAEDIPGFHFHEYWYSESEFRDILVKNGFKIMFSEGMYILGGMSDYRLFRGILRSGRSVKKNGDEQISDAKKNSFILTRMSHIAKIRSVLVEEKGDFFMGHQVLSCLKHLFSHLIVFVCKAQK